jgi:hypothetical protein
LYLQGVYEGIIIGGSKAGDNFIMNIDLTSLAGAVDMFYDDEKYIEIPVVAALTIISSELNGFDNEKIEYFKNEVLQIYTDIQLKNKLLK